MAEKKERRFKKHVGVVMTAGGLGQAYGDTAGGWNEVLISTDLNSGDSRHEQMVGENEVNHSFRNRHGPRA